MPTDLGIFAKQVNVEIVSQKKLNPDKSNRCPRVNIKILADKDFSFMVSLSCHKHVIWYIGAYIRDNIVAFPNPL